MDISILDIGKACAFVQGPSIRIGELTELTFRQTEPQIECILRASETGGEVGVVNYHVPASDVRVLLPQPYYLKDALAECLPSLRVKDKVADQLLHALEQRDEKIKKQSDAIKAKQEKEMLT